MHNIKTKELKAEINRLKNELHNAEGRIQTREVPMLSDKDLEQWSLIIRDGIAQVTRVANGLLLKLEEANNRSKPNPNYTLPKFRRK